MDHSGSFIFFIALYFIISQHLKWQSQKELIFANLANIKHILLEPIKQVIILYLQKLRVNEKGEFQPKEGTYQAS